jgi:hypothetical protein
MSHMTIKTTHHVTFLSPGTFVSEQTTKPIDSWNVAVATEMATNIVERYDARPYAFYFTTKITADDVPDDSGGFLQVQPRETERSGRHFLNGNVLTLDDVQRRGDKNDSILVINMRNNQPIICETSNGYRHTAPFENGDVVVNASGDVVERGDTPERIAYRAKMLAHDIEAPS